MLPPPDRGGEKCPKNWAVCVLDDKKGRSTLTLIIILVNMQPIPQDQLMTVAHSCALLKTQESFSSFLKTLQHSSEGVGEPGTFYRGFARRSHAVRCWKPPSTELRPIFKEQGLIVQNNLCLKNHRRLHLGGSRSPSNWMSSSLKAKIAQVKRWRGRQRSAVSVVKLVRMSSGAVRMMKYLRRIVRISTLDSRSRPPARACSPGPRTSAEIG